MSPAPPETETPLLLNDGADNQISLLTRLTKTSIGRRSDDGSLKVGAEEPHGYVFTGRLCRLTAGLYRLDIRCGAGTPNATNLPVLCLEVIATSRGLQASRDFTADELESGHATIEFFVTLDSDAEPAEFNFKFYHFGNSDIKITDVKLTRMVGDAPDKRELLAWRLLGRLRIRKIAKPRKDGEVRVKRQKRAGCFLDGPRAFLLPQGHYQLKLSCAAGAAKRRGQPVLGVEIMARNRHQLAWRDFTVEELERGPAIIAFAVPANLGDLRGEQATFNFAFYHLGNSDLAIRAVDLNEMPQDAVPAITQPVWRLLARLQKSWRACDILNGGLARNAAPARRILHRIRPHLKLRAGHYLVRLDASAELLNGSTGPAISIEVTVRGILRPSHRLRSLFEVMHWRTRGTIATVATRQFTVSELNAGECVLPFDVPFEWSIESGADVWIDLRLVRLSNAAIDIKDVAIGGWAQHQDDDNAARSPPRKATHRSTRKAVVVIGNCQAEIVAHQFRELPLAERFSVNFHSFDLPDHKMEEGKRTIDDAEFVLVQDIQNWAEYPLKEHIRDTARIVRFPCLRFASLWPYDSFNGPGDPDALKYDWPQQKFPLFDGALARLRKEIPDPEMRFARYAALKMDFAVDPTRLHAFEQRRLLAMDRRFECEIGQFILDVFRKQRLFHTTAHPHGKLFAMLLAHLFKSMGISDFAPNGNEVDRHFNGVQVPVHPMVGHILGVKWATKRARYLFDGKQVTWETYMRRYIGYYG
jgi:Polysaccharide biosynthesis enzyme WcbI